MDSKLQLRQIPSALQLFSGFVLVVTLSYFAYKYRRMRGTKDLPGPKGLPIVGSLYQVTDPFKYFRHIRQWANEYGPIYQYYVGTQKHVIISSDKVARDLFMTRASNYEDRLIPHALEWATMNINPALRRMDDGWRRQRTFVRKSISMKANKENQESIEDETNHTLREFLKWTPSELASELPYNKFLRLAYSLLTTTMMGFSLASYTDEYILETEKARNRFLATHSFTLFPSNLFPFLSKLPNSLVWNFSIMERLRQDYMNQMVLLKQRIEKGITNGTAVKCVYQDFIQNRDDYNVTDEELFYTFQAILGAGSHNPPQLMLTTLCSLVKYPEWQEKAFEEIDRVVGGDRLPHHTDIPNLPTIRAILKEGLRRRSREKEAGLPRASVEDDFYDGYFIEKGTIFHLNLHALLVDKDVYPDEKIFNPARYLEPSYPTFREPLTVHPNFQGFNAFGYGKRACPGNDFAERTCVIMLAKFIWAYRILEPLSTGEKPTKPYDVMDWKFRLAVRDEKRAKIVEDTALTSSLKI